MRIFIITLISLFQLSFINAQDAKFTVEVSSDSILMGNYFEVTFSIENGKGQNFQAPDFQDFLIVGGPNQSSSFSMVNGVTTQSMRYTYYLEPKEAGLLYIEPANVELDGVIIETEPIAIKVASNPEGIIQSPNKQKNRTFDNFDSFFDQPFFQERERRAPSKPKKKRKIIWI